MYKTVSFKKKLLATLVASSTLGLSSFAFAQDNEAEEIVVTGIKASLTAAMDIKRDAVGVVDAISSEDIGKMPDANLAESLQRITGLSINRSNGEGSQVTVRGIDPSLNMVTLNGRVMPAVSNGNAGDNASRAYDFANLASETISGVEVYKTGKAHLPSGGLGASINIKSLRPLDAGTKASFGAKAVKDSTVDNSIGGAEFTPEVSGLYSWANEENTFGVALTGAYQERDSARSNVFVNNWQVKTAGAATFDKDDPTKQLTTDGTLPFGAKVTNAPKAGQLYNLPTDMRYSIEDQHRVRQNAQLTIQFRPVENLTGTLDYTYSENDITADRSQQSTWYNIDKISEISFDNGVVKSPLLYKETYPGGGKDVSFAQQAFDTNTQNNSFGFNLAYEASDALKFEFDYHNSSAESVTNQAEAGLNANIVTGNYADWSNDMPVMGVVINDSSAKQGNNNQVLDGGDVSGAMGSIAYGHQITEIEQARLSGSYNFGDIAGLTNVSVDFGADTRTDSNLTQVGDGTSPRITMGNWGGVDPDVFGSDWPGYFSVRDFGKAFPDFSASTGNGNFLRGGLDANPAQVFQKMEALYAEAQTRQWYHVGDDPSTTNAVEADWGYWVNPKLPGADLAAKRDDFVNPSNFANFPNGKYQFNGVIDTNRTIEEKVNAFYVAFKGGFEIAGLASNIGVGVRYEETDVTSSSVVRRPSMLEWQEDNDWAVLLENRAATPLTRTSSYDNVLPNLDFDISPTDDIKVRFSYSETIGRAGYGQLRSDSKIDSPYNRKATSGNPSLKPMESTNFDLSAEWYYDDASYVSAGYFIKDVSNFIGDIVTQGELYGLRDVRKGAQFNSVAANLTSEEAQHNAMLIAQGKNPNDKSTSVYATAADPFVQWDITQPGNDKDAKIDGIELAVQHWFGDTGFGVQANYTKVDADVEFDITKTGNQFAMIGLSDSANLVAFYDKDAWQIRVAYNWRDEFLNSRTQGGGNEPSFTEAFGQIDFSASYDLTEQVTFSLEGLNITGEDSRSHGRGDAQVNNLEDLGSRYLAGVRYTF